MESFLLTILFRGRPWVTRNRHIGCLALLYVCLICPSNVSALQVQNPPVALTRLTYQNTNGCTGAVIHLSGPLEFFKQRLRHPERFYIDLKNATIGTGFKRLYPVKENLVRTIRAGQFDADTVRIVFDLTSDKYDVEAVFLRNPYRIAVHICRKHEDNQVRVRRSSHATSSFIPEENWITDFEARLALARILSYDDNTLDKSLKEYRIMLKQKPGNRLLSLEMARLLIRKGQAEEALSILGSIRAMHPNDPETLVALADLEASLGHAARSRDLYMDAVRVSDQPEITKLKLADRMNMWGDFHKVETIYRENLNAHPEDRSVALQLAALLRSSERYGESEGMYRLLLAESPDSKEVLMGLAQVKRRKKTSMPPENRLTDGLNLSPMTPKGFC